MRVSEVKKIAIKYNVSYTQVNAIIKSFPTSYDKVLKDKDTLKYFVSDLHQLSDTYFLSIAQIRKLYTKAKSLRHFYTLAEKAAPIIKSEKVYTKELQPHEIVKYGPDFLSQIPDLLYFLEQSLIDELQVIP